MGTNDENHKGSHTRNLERVNKTDQSDKQKPLKNNHVTFDGSYPIEDLLIITVGIIIVGLALVFLNIQVKKEAIFQSEVLPVVVSIVIFILLIVLLILYISSYTAFWEVYTLAAPIECIIFNSPNLFEIELDDSEVKNIEITLSDGTKVTPTFYYISSQKIVDGIWQVKLILDEPLYILYGEIHNFTFRDINLQLEPISRSRYYSSNLRKLDTLIIDVNSSEILDPDLLKSKKLILEEELQSLQGKLFFKKGTPTEFVVKILLSLVIATPLIFMIIAMAVDPTAFQWENLQYVLLGLGMALFFIIIGYRWIWVSQKRLLNEYTSKKKELQRIIEQSES